MARTTNLPTWLHQHFATVLTPIELAIVDREWFTYSQISFRNSPMSELLAEARAILAIQVGA